MTYAINFIHWFLIAPLLLYIGIENINKKPINSVVAGIVIFLAVVVFIYHLFLFIKKLKQI